MPAPRLLHPGAWWLWALGLATAAARTTDPLLLAVIAAVAAVVVSERRVPGPWSRSYAAFLKLGIAVIVVRIVLEVAMGATDVGTPLVTLPEIPLPAWLAGVRLGGLVTVEGMLLAIFDGMRLAVMLCCIGAANALVNPSRLLRIVPAALYEAGLAVVVCMTVAPILISDFARVRAARRLRGRTTRGVRAWGEIAMPLFSAALDRSVALAASMDARGYGRTAGQPRRMRLANSLLLVMGLMGVAVGLYGLLDGGTPGVAGIPLFGWPMIVFGCGAATVGTLWAGRRLRRTRYRPDPWRWPEWLVAICGVVPAVVFVALGTEPLFGPVSPPGWPAPPPIALLAVLMAAVPAFATPSVPRVEAAPSGSVPVREKVPA